MSFITSHKPYYVQNFTLLNGINDFDKIYCLHLNEVSFQVQFPTGKTGSIEVFGSNQDLPNTGGSSNVSANQVLNPILLETIDISAAPYVTQGWAGIEITTGYAWIWVRYQGAGTFPISIAFAGKGFN